MKVGTLLTTASLPAISLLFIPLSSSAEANLEAGKARAASVCAACHGVNGVSVAEHIPNLAGQRAGYLQAQLNAFKSGDRKNSSMSVIAPQLSEADIANVAAYFASQAGTSGASKSTFLPNLATHMTLPADFKVGFKAYHVTNNEDSNTVTVSYASDVAVTAAAAGKPLPSGSAIFNVTYSAKLAADGKLLKDSNGNFVRDQIKGYAAMAAQTGWGAEVPEMLRNGDWNYALFTADGTPRKFNQAECMACHKPKESSSYVFNLQRLADYGKK